jgi:hypothetical protein
VSQSVPIGDTGQRITLRYIGMPAISLVVGSLFIAGAIATSGSLGHAIPLVLGGGMLAFGLSMMSSHEIAGGRLVVRRLIRRKATILLSELTSADCSIGDSWISKVSSRDGGRAVSLRLRDRQGTMTVLSSSEYAKTRWQQALSALAPYVMAPGVQRTGPVEDALAGL